MIYVFLLDTSFSMNQRLDGSLSCLELAKSGIEHFVKAVSERRNHVQDDQHKHTHYMLITYDSLNCIKTGIKDDERSLLNELKYLTASDLSSPSASLSALFHHLDVYRIHRNLETPGRGMFPGISEPTVILWFTDGGMMTSPEGVTDRLNITHSQPGNQIYPLEPFRWDQRLYTIFLHPPGTKMNWEIKLMSEATGGWAHAVSEFRQLKHLLGSMLHGQFKYALWRGVVAQFLDTTVEGGVLFRRFLHLHPDSPPGGYYPIPEPYWPEPGQLTLSGRPCQPLLCYTRQTESIVIPAGLPFDKYELQQEEHQPLAQLIASTVVPGTGRNVQCWPVCVRGSQRRDRSDRAAPFGFLRGNTSGGVTLYVLPFNFPHLFTLIEEFRKQPNAAASPSWMNKFKEYLSGVPCYYGKCYKEVFKHLGMGHLTPSNFGVTPSGINQHVEKIKAMAKKEYDILFNQPASVVTSNVAAERPLPTNAFDVPRNELHSRWTDLWNGFLKEVGHPIGKGKAEDGEVSVPIAAMGQWKEAKGLRIVDPELARRQAEQDKYRMGNLYKLESMKFGSYNVDRDWAPVPPDSPLLAPASLALAPRRQGKPDDPLTPKLYLLRGRTSKRTRTQAPAPFRFTAIPPLSPVMKAADAGAAAAAAAGGPFLSVKEDENRYYSRRDHKDIGMDFAASLASHHPRTPEAKREPDAEYPEPSELNGADDVDGVSPLMLRNAEDDEGDGDYRWGPTETEAAGVRIMESDGGGGGGGGGGGSGPLSDPRKLPFPSSSGADVDVEDISDIDDYEPPAPATKAPAPLVPAKREASAGPEVAKRAAPAPEKLTARPQMQRPSDADAAEAAKATCGDARPESRGKAAPAGVPAEPEKLSTKKEGLAEANGTEPSLEEILETIQKHIRSKVSRDFDQHLHDLIGSLVLPLPFWKQQIVVSRTFALARGMKQDFLARKLLEMPATRSQ